MTTLVLSIYLLLAQWRQPHPGVLFFCDGQPCSCEEFMRQLDETVPVWGWDYLEPIGSTYTP